jgi:hypothetical protein
MSKETWAPRNIYLYLVCLVTLIMTIISATNTVRAVVELAYPNPQTAMVRPAPLGEEVERNEEQLAEERQARRRAEQRRSVLDLVGSATMLLIAGPLYIYHWRKIERGQEEGAKEVR